MSSQLIWIALTNVQECWIKTYRSSANAHVQDISEVNGQFSSKLETLQTLFRESICPKSLHCWLPSVWVGPTLICFGFASSFFFQKRVKGISFLFLVYPAWHFSDFLIFLFKAICSIFLLTFPPRHFLCVFSFVCCLSQDRGPCDNEQR